MRVLPVLLVLNVLCANTAAAKRNTQPKASQLDAKIAEANYLKPPNYSMAWTVGTILRKDEGGNITIAASDCFVYEAERKNAAGFFMESQIDVTIGGGLVPVSAKGKTQYVQQATLKEPVVQTIPELSLKLTDACSALTGRIGANISAYYVVQETLLGSFQNIKCGSIDAKGNFQVVDAGVEYSSMCLDVSPGEVVLGYKLLPLVSVLSNNEVKSSGIKLMQTAQSTSVNFTTAGVQDIMAQIEQGKRLEESLETNITQCLANAAAATAQKAHEDYVVLKQALDVTTNSTRRFVEPLALTYVKNYQEPVVTCTNELGTRTKTLQLYEAVEVQAWLDDSSPATPYGSTRTYPEVSVYASNLEMVPRKQRAEIAGVFAVMAIVGGIVPFVIIDVATD